MARTLNRLTARQVVTLKQPGRYADGGGLYLRLTPAGSRSWVFMNAREGKRIEIGLGAASAISLVAARLLAGKMRDAIALGHDPRSALAIGAVKNATVPSFSEVAESYISSVEDGWKSDVHRQQWRQSLRDYTKAIAHIPVDRIDTEDVLAALNPIWLTKAETARRLRGRIERILDVAKVRGLRPRDAMNPAAWRGHLALLMPQQSKAAKSHHAALPWQDAPAFISLLRKRPAVSARCLEFIILTAARSGEALGATWAEIDLTRKMWIVPATRMKAGKEHEVPLSEAAVELLKAIRPKTPDPKCAVFAVSGTARSNMAITMLLRRMGFGHITTHGFRSTFRDWAGDATTAPREIAEHALAHTIQSKSERPYRRGTAIDHRRALMEEWATYLKG